MRQSRDGDWEGVARKVEAIDQLVEGMAEDQSAFNHIERKAHDAAAKSSKRHAHLVRVIAELTALLGDR